jgi:hypothetical protein
MSDSIIKEKMCIIHMLLYPPFSIPYLILSSGALSLSLPFHFPSRRLSREY